MKIYKVKVNGKIYEVELEAVDEVQGNVQKETSKVDDSKPVEGANNILAPIAGKIVKLNVKVGDHVKKGQTVAVIEAMKLENEIQSTFDGTVVDVKVNKGSSVNNKDVLIVIG